MKPFNAIGLRIAAGADQRPAGAPPALRLAVGLTSAGAFCLLHSPKAAHCEVYPAGMPPREIPAPARE